MRYLFLLAALVGAAQADELGFNPGGCIVGELDLTAYTDVGALRKARVNGKYRMLLRQIKAPQDAKTYGAFRDYGHYGAVQDYAGHKDLPAGYWVYAYPYWFIWAQKDAAGKARPWGPEQATGAPNTPAGDKRTAWAPRTQNGGIEWLMVEYAQPVRPIGVIVYENNAPGALVTITAYKPDGTAVVVWTGSDPSPAGHARGTSLVPVRVDFDVTRIKLAFDTKKVKGWNEVDAVGLLDGQAKTHWAESAHASSYYGEKPTRPIVVPGPIHIFPVPQPDEERKKLLAEIERLKKLVKELQKNHPADSTPR